MSRNRFRVQLEPQNEPSSSAESPSHDVDTRPPTFDSQVRVFSTSGQHDWVLRKQKKRAPHRRRGASATASVAKQEISPKDGLSSSASSDQEHVKELDSAIRRRRKNRPRDSPSLTAESTTSIPPSVTAQRRQPSSTSAADSILNDLRPHPHALTVEEQNFVIKWLQYQATVFWSSNSTGSFDPCRDIAWRGIQMYPAGGLPWTLIFFDMFLAWSRRQPFPQRLHQRKALAYQYIAKLLADPETQASDEALLCVCLAMSTDARSLSPEINRVHLKGLAQMISKRGVGSLFSALCFMSHPMFSLAYFAMAELEATSMLDVQSATRRFLETLHSMQRDGSRSQPKVVRRRSDEDVKPNIDSRSISYRSSSLWSVAMGKSTIHHAVESVLVKSQGRTLSIQQNLALFLDLYLLNLILWDLLKSPGSATVFLQRLSLCADNAQVRLDVCVWLLAKSWVDADETSKRADGGARKEVFLTEAVIDALKVYSRLTYKTRGKLVIVLSSWLFGCGEEDEEGEESDSIDPAVNETEQPSSSKANNVSSHIARGVAGSLEPSVSAQKSAADHRTREKGIDPKLSPSPQRPQVHGAGITSKVFKYLSSRDFEVMRNEAYSDWYEKNVSKSPMPALPMVPAPPPSASGSASGSSSATERRSLNK
ncbi:uncharacterized protein Z520_00229 [Fonsecaea multimorphosa CBS 102226]|uniref:Uncharacterized protein n=1 Tax=Fonsecaea multimorphosa CBS 102226 TaxID=1442371 RepID=A0A0D2KBS9_9EURO|nr:uncharacterized protein Z520_00229 [Fonsecaea multimorphosa CBS 102226]KIY03538.1 hypothetical protein Z520_00229 [Fonsecaea multimorphosa CBS 102226]OAL32242.1 hypothetical protein AYO22_00264 [Fonsecaea multimorphosa]